MKNKELGKLKIKAHAYFDLLWKQGLMTRKQVYSNLVTWMDLTTQHNAHIKQFNQEQCERLINICKEKYPSLYEGKDYLDSNLFYA